MTQSSNKPIVSLRDGSLKVAVFANETENSVRYSGQLVRSYRDQDGNWRDTSYLSNTEFLRAGNLLIRVYEQIQQLKAEDKDQGDNGGSS